MPNIAELRSKNIRKNDEKIAKKAQKAKEKEERFDSIALRREDFSKEYKLKKETKLSARISQVKEKWSIKNNKIELAKKEITNSQTKEELEKLSNSKFVTYYEKRISLLEKSFAKKIKKIEYKISVAKISEEEGKQLLEKTRIDEGAAYDRWDRKIAAKKAATTENKLNHKLSKNKKMELDELESVKRRTKASLPSTSLQAIKDKWSDVKSKHLFGLEIRTIMDKFSSHFRRFSMFYILGFIIVVFAIGTHGDNLKSQNFVNILESNTYVLIIGLGMLMVIVAGYIDLSVGAMMGFMGALSVMVFNSTGNIWVTIVLIMLIGAAIGFVQGFMIGYLKMPAFIVTLGAMLLFQGLILTITKSMTIIPSTDLLTGKSQFIEFIMGAMPDVTAGSFHIFAFFIIFAFGILSVALMIMGRNKKAKFGVATDSTLSFWMKIALIVALFSVVAFWIANSLFGLKYYIIYIMLLVVFFIFITQNTSFGRKIYAIGGNKKAAELSGINSKRVTVAIFMITGALVGFASIVYTAIASNASPTVSSAGYELDVISSVFVGGASMAGGIGTIPGTFIGGLVLGYINNGMALMNFKADMQKIIKAIVLLSAVGYDIYANRKMG